MDALILCIAASFAPWSHSCVTPSALPMIPMPRWLCGAWAGQQVGVARLVEYLLQNGAVLEAPDPHGKTPLHYAVIFGRVGAVTLLLRRGANRCVGELCTLLACAVHAHRVIADRGGFEAPGFCLEEDAASQNRMLDDLHHQSKCTSMTCQTCLAALDRVMPAMVASSLGHLIAI